MQNTTATMAQLNIADGSSVTDAPEVLDGVAGPVLDPVLPADAAPVLADPVDALPADAVGVAVPAVTPLATPDATTPNVWLCVAAAFCALNGTGVITLVKLGNSSKA